MGRGLPRILGTQTPAWPNRNGGFYVADPDILPPVVVGSTGYFDDCDEMPGTMPHRYEAGTPNAPGIAGLAACCRALLDKGIGEIRKEQVSLIRHVLKSFREIPEVKFPGPTDARKRVGVIGFNIGKLHPAEVGSFLDQKFDIMVRTGVCSCHWANEITGTMPDGLVRASFGYFTGRHAASDRSGYNDLRGRST